MPLQYGAGLTLAIVDAYPRERRNGRRAKDRFITRNGVADMAQPKSHLEIALASIPVFTNDGTLDVAELQKLLDLALRDKIVDEDEKRVLGNIFKQAELGQLDAQVKHRIDEARALHGISA
jgi:hypothetical protein